MHELSIVEALIDQVAKELDRAGQQGRVARLELNVGRLSGVNCDSLRFAFNMLAAGTIVADAELVTHEPKPICHCHTCQVKSEIDDLVVRCPKCESCEITIEGGRELVLQSIEIVE
jgi:hydrogenase nickel incorporation protein HypA/HybF